MIHGAPKSFEDFRRALRPTLKLGLLAMVLGFTGPIRAQHPGHPPMPDQRLYLQVAWGEKPAAATLDVSLNLGSTLAESELNQVVELQGSTTPIRLKRYLPQATLVQSVVPFEGENAKPGVELEIEGPTQSFRRWLIADDPERNRLVSFIGTWRFMAVPDRESRDALYDQFRTEFTREPRLFVTRTDGGPARPVPMQIDAVQSLDELGCKVRVLRFFPDYAMDREKQEAVNRSSQRRNPAVQVEVAFEGRTEQRWVFSKFPEFGLKDGGTLPFRFTLDCPAEGSGTTPDFVLIALRGAEFEVWTRNAGEVTRAPLSLKSLIPVTGSQYRFQLSSFVSAGRMLEVYKAAEQGKGVAALQVEVPSPGGTSAPCWLGLGESKTVSSLVGPMTLRFLTGSAERPEGHP